MTQKYSRLLDIQHAYFALLERYFAQPFAEMRRFRVSPYEIAQQIANQEKTVRAFVSDAEDMAAEFRQFWHAVHTPLESHLAALQGLKAVFGGDIAPSYTTNIARSAGLYIDTILLPDPLLRVGEFFHTMNPHAAVFYTVKHALNILNYKSLALTELTPPLLVMIPDYALEDTTTHQMLLTSSYADLLFHCSKLFGQDFSTQEELSTFLKSTSGWEDFASRLVEPTRLLMDAESSASPSEQLHQFRSEQERNFGPQLLESWDQAVSMAFLGRMLSTNKSILNSSHYHGTPLIDAPTSWQYLLWKYEYDSARGREPRQDAKEMVVTKVLQDITLLTDLPEKTLLDLRRRGAVSELRALLSQNIHDIDTSSPSLLPEVTQQVSANLEEAFTKHKQELDKHTRSKTFFGLEVGSFVATGSVAITATSMGSVPLAILATALGLIGIPSAKDLWGKGKDLLATNQELKRSPAGILFHQKKPKK